MLNITFKSIEPTLDANQTFHILEQKTRLLLRVRLESIYFAEIENLLLKIL